jgi:hypothetical protein
MEGVGGEVKWGVYEIMVVTAEGSELNDQGKAHSASPLKISSVFVSRLPTLA